jgi:hypothetical protein
MLKKKRSYEVRSPVTNSPGDELALWNSLAESEQANDRLREEIDRLKNSLNSVQSIPIAENSCPKPAFGVPMAK